MLVVVTTSRDMTLSFAYFTVRTAGCRPLPVSRRDGDTGEQRHQQLLVLSERHGNGRVLPAERQHTARARRHVDART